MVEWNNFTNKNQIYPKKKKANIFNYVVTLKLSTNNFTRIEVSLYLSGILSHSSLFISKANRSIKTLGKPSFIKGGWRARATSDGLSKMANNSPTFCSTYKSTLIWDKNKSETTIPPGKINTV